MNQKAPDLEQYGLEPVVDRIIQKYPNTQAIYLFGTWGTDYQRPDSDLDIAVLLPFEEAKAIDPTEWSLHFAVELAEIATAEAVDLINLRCVESHVLQIEVIDGGRLLYDPDKEQRQEFEMLAISMYWQWWDRYQFNKKEFEKMKSDEQEAK